MKTYRFRLEAVARARRGQVLLARQEVARVQRELERAAGHEATAAQSYQQFLVSEEPVSGDSFVARFEQGERLAVSAQTAAGIRRNLEHQLALARQAAQRAERNVALLDKLDERRRHEWVLEAQREDAAVLDEFATVRAITGRMPAGRWDGPAGAA